MTGRIRAWQNILKRKPRCVEWSEAEIRALVDEEKFERTLETSRKISPTELMRYQNRQATACNIASAGSGDSAMAVVSTDGKPSLSADNFIPNNLEPAHAEPVPKPA